MRKRPFNLRAGNIATKCFARRQRLRIASLPSSPTPTRARRECFGLRRTCYCDRLRDLHRAIDVNSSKLFTCNTASLVAGLQAAGSTDATVVAIVDDITIMGTLEAMKAIDSVRVRLQEPANYRVNLTKQYV